MVLKIVSVKVNGGFLDGLDLDFSNGLNVLIGPRGVGKTSIIELIRFALGGANYVEDSSSESRDHALAVLRDGEVNVVIENNGAIHKFSRAAEDPAPSAFRFPPPIIFSQ